MSEVHKAAASMMRAAKLGQARTTETDIPALGNVARTEADIRTAVGRLSNPALRLRDRLFWFHQPPLVEKRAAPTFTTEAIPTEKIARSHDDALRCLLTAFEATLDDAGVSVWSRALRAWHQTVSDDDYWSLSLNLEEQGSFEPVALLSDLDDLRDDALRLAADGLIVAGREALTRNDASTVRRILVTLENLGDTGRWAAAAQEDIAFPAVERFRELCKAVREECVSKIVRDQDSTEHNKNVCEASLKRFQDEINPSLNKLIGLLSPESEEARRAREDAALSLSGIATNYTWADDFITSEKLHEEALELAQNTSGAFRIEEGLTEVREPARKQRVFGALKPISSAPSLRTINGVGFTLYGRSDYDQETHSYATTHYFVVFFIPVFPISRYRVINTDSHQYRFLGKLPLRKIDRWHLGIAAASILAGIISIGINSNQNSGTPYTSSPRPPSTDSPKAGSTDRNNYESRKTQLSNLKTRLEAGRSRMKRLESQLQPVTDKLTTLTSSMETITSELKSLDQQRNEGVNIDIEDYNAKVDSYNKLLSRYRELEFSISNDLELYKKMSKEDEELVAQYNALLR